MSEIICQWLNEELSLSKRVEPKCFAKEFATGYLIGEVLHMYQLQDDFDQFSQSRAAISKLNNFTRIEPTLHLLGIPFDQNVAQDIIGEQHGAATRLLYQMYIALQKKKKAGLTGVAMETMRPAAPAKLQSIGTEMYRERLKTIVPRQTNVNLQKVTEHFDLKAKEMNGKLAQMQIEELNKIQKVQEQLRLEDIDKLRRARRRQTEIMARIQAAIVQIPKPPTNRTLKVIEAQKMLKRRKEAEYVYKELERFEKTAKRNGSSSSISPTTRTPTLQRLRSTASIGTALIKLNSSDDYVKKIQKRLEEDTEAREQREKRRRRILMEQLTAHGAQEEVLREEQLVSRLMRQSQQERRIAVQLMHIRHEKDILKQNRIFRETQYEERRKKEFQEALDREAAVQKQEKLDCEEQIRKIQELHDMIAAERAEARYKKHYFMCQQVMDQIVDLVTKTGEYRDLTNRLIPAKLMREWKELFFTGYPLYEDASLDPMPLEPSPEQLLELEKESLLDEKEYEEYKAMTGEWVPSEDLGFKAPAPNNNILGHVVGRLLDIVHPPKAPTPPPVFPPFPIKGCVLGKLFSGKTKCLRYLAQAYGVQVLDVDTLINEAIQAFHDNEMENTVTLSEPIENDQENKCVDSSSSAHNESEASTEESITKENDLNDIPQDQIFKSSEGENAILKLSERAQLGEMLEKQLRKGKGASDDLLIRIIINAINRIPQNTGWILDGFPTTVIQARLFEKAFTGVDFEKTTENNKKAKSSSLVTNPTGHKDVPPTSPALDFAVLIDISDSVVLQRATRQLGTAELPVSHESLSSNIDPPKDNQPQARDHIQHRIIGFLDNWEKLEMWLSAHQNILIKVNGEVEEDVLYKKIEEIFLTAVFQKENKASVEEKKEEIPHPPTPPVTPPPPEPTIDPRPSSPSKPESARKGRRDSKSPKGSARSKDKSAEKKEKKTDKPRGKEPGQKSPKSGSPRGRSPGKKSVTPAPPELQEPIHNEPPPVQPGSTEWVYVDEPLPQDIPEYLAPYWENIENEYGITIKTALGNLRKERLIVINYLYDIRNKFKHYLKRPDHKQEFVSQWQSDFSSVADDLWEDEETKAELHQRVDDLRDRLWDICDNRKDEAEHERNDIMNEGWLPDHLGILVNHFFSIMQADVDRFQDTARLLHDYYQGMESKIPSEATKEFPRIALLDIFSSDIEGESEKPTRISLVPRRPQSPEQNPVKQKSKTAMAKGKEDQLVELSKQILESDEKLIVDTWQTALSAVTNMAAHDKQVKEMEEEKERQVLEIKEKERLKASQTAARGSGKGSKKKPPNPKSPKGNRGGKSPGPVEATPSVATSEETAELQKKQDVKHKMKQEYFCALECEEAAAKSRIDLVKSKAIDVCQDLVSKTEQAYKDMEMWLGARFLEEMSSIEKLIRVARHHIESSIRIQYELVLEQGDFYISSDVKVIPDPPPPPPHQPMEKSNNTTLKISQLSAMYKQFIQVAPEGLMSNKLFTEILADITVNIANDVLPESWMYLPLSEIQEITSALSLNSDVVNWRTFLLSASLPWPYPSVSQLLNTLHRFQATDEDRCGTINEENYNQAQLWFTGIAEEQDNSTEPPFNRLEHLIKFFFVMFADQQRNPPLLDYTEMLLYFAAHADPKEGFYRALSVAAGKPLLKNPEDNILLKSVAAMNLDHSGMEEAAMQNSEEATVSLEEVLRVFQHGASKDGDNHRFNLQQKQTNDCFKSIKHIFNEFNPENMEPVAVSSLLKHPAFQDLVENCQFFKLPDIHGILHKSRHMQLSEGGCSTPCSQ